MVSKFPLLQYEYGKGIILCVRLMMVCVTVVWGCKDYTTGLELVSWGQYIGVEPTHLNAKPKHLVLDATQRIRTWRVVLILSKCIVQWWTHGWLLCKVIRINASKSIHTWHTTPPWKCSTFSQNLSLKIPILLF